MVDITEVKQVDVLGWLCCVEDECSWEKTSW